MGLLSAESAEFLERCRRSRKLILIIVAIALLLDNITSPRQKINHQSEKETEVLMFQYDNGS